MVEFGLIREGGAIRAYGAGILSSSAETLNATEGTRPAGCASMCGACCAANYFIDAPAADLLRHRRASRSVRARCRPPRAAGSRARCRSDPPGAAAPGDQAHLLRRRIMDIPPDRTPLAASSRTPTRWAPTASNSSSSPAPTCRRWNAVHPARLPAVAHHRSKQVTLLAPGRRQLHPERRAGQLRPGLRARARPCACAMAFRVRPMPPPPTSGAIELGAKPVLGTRRADGAEHPGDRGHRRQPDLLRRPLRRRAGSIYDVDFRWPCEGAERRSRRATA